MGRPKLALDVKLFTAVTFNNKDVYEEVKSVLEQKFGAIDTLSAIYDFNFTRYYAAEMGTNLKKQFLGFEKLIRPEDLPDVKLITNDIETSFSKNGNRLVNIDPGYLTSAKVVLATTKNYDHRIYLGKGIYGDVHLRYRQKKFHFNDWTYPDYREMIVIEFLSRLRDKFMKEIPDVAKLH
ncbi:MAG: DUF4416 family protein [bacterium]|nr:MAG: DUF4416 family protein [bacterium]